MIESTLYIFNIPKLTCFCGGAYGKTETTTLFSEPKTPFLTPQNDPPRDPPSPPGPPIWTPPWTPPFWVPPPKTSKKGSKKGAGSLGVFYPLPPIPEKREKVKKIQKPYPDTFIFSKNVKIINFITFSGPCPPPWLTIFRVLGGPGGGTPGGVVLGVPGGPGGCACAKVIYQNFFFWRGGPRGGRGIDGLCPSEGET